MRTRQWLPSAAAWVMLCSCAATEPGIPSPATGEPAVRVSYVGYPVTTPKATLNLGAVLRVPGDGKSVVPAVVIVHGSAGVDGRGNTLAIELNRVGIATLEIDLWTARGIRSPADRPASVAETLPDVYAAFKVLAATPGIDKQRIGVTGFSWGGVVSMLTATRRYSEMYLGKDTKFAAHAPHYPVCWVYNRAPGYEFRDLTGAPVFLQAGAEDDYDQPDTCPKLAASLAATDRALVSVRVYPGATHGWDGSGPPTSHIDPYAHMGKGGPFRFHANPAVAKQSRAATVLFFRCRLGLGGCDATQAP